MHHRSIVVAFLLALLAALCCAKLVGSGGHDIHGLKAMEGAHEVLVGGFQHDFPSLTRRRRMRIFRNTKKYLPPIVIGYLAYYTFRKLHDGWTTYRVKGDFPHPAPEMVKDWNEKKPLVDLMREQLKQLKLLEAS